MDPSTGPAPEATSEPSHPGPAEGFGDVSAKAPSKVVPPSVDSAGRPIAAGRYIVVLAGDADPTKVLSTHRSREGTMAERAFKHAFRASRPGWTRRSAPRSLPIKVLAVVPDEVIEITAQSMPTGISRVGATTSALSRISGVDERVDADVAIVDTGIGPHSDLNIAGRYNCSTADRTRWNDENGHGTHVAGTVGAKDNTWGVVGVARASASGPSAS